MTQDSVEGRPDRLVTNEAKHVKIAVVAVIAVCWLALAGCVGATRLPTRAKGAAGERVETKQLDLSFLQTGATSRDEVMAKLSMIDSGYADRSLFWGRWAVSKWGYWWFVMGQNTGAGDAKRVWHVKNLLVTFDEHGVMQDKQVIDDDKLLWRQLHSFVARAAPHDPGQQVSITTLWRRSGQPSSQITLAPAWMEIERRKQDAAQVAPSKVVRISHEGHTHGDSMALTCHSLHFSEKTPAGRAFTFCADGPTVIAVFQYFQRAGRADMLWE